MVLVRAEGAKAPRRVCQSSLILKKSQRGCVNKVPEEQNLYVLSGVLKHLPLQAYWVISTVQVDIASRLSANSWNRDADFVEPRHFF